MGRGSSTSGMLAAAIVLAFCTNAIALGASGHSELTAEAILRRSAAAQGIGKQPTIADAKLAYITENGHTRSELVLVKSPNKLLLRDEYPWLHLLVYRGYDGRRAWTSSNFGGGGLADPKSARLLRSTLAWYLVADMVAGWWPVKAVRLPDRTVKGRSYYALEEIPRGGTPSYVLFDKKTFATVAVGSVPDRFFFCIKRKSIRASCLRQEIITGGRVTGIIDIKSWHEALDDSQFEMPSMLNDWTTGALLSSYRSAIGNDRAKRALEGSWVSPSGLVAKWRLEMASPMTFVNSYSFSGREFFRLSFDGTRGTTFARQSTRNASYVAAVYAMAYNRCELNADECDVSVQRLPNVSLDRRSFYALGVVSKRTPYLWYTMLLDAQTLLPYAYWLRDTVLYLSDYTTAGSGQTVPAIWDYQGLRVELKVLNVREVAPVVP